MSAAGEAKGKCAAEVTGGEFRVAAEENGDGDTTEVWKAIWQHFEESETVSGGGRDPCEDNWNSIVREQENRTPVKQTNQDKHYAYFKLKSRTPTAKYIGFSWLR